MSMIINLASQARQAPTRNFLATAFSCILCICTPCWALLRFPGCVLRSGWRANWNFETAEMIIPQLLIVELRMAFKTCARQHSARPPLSRDFRTSPYLSKRNQKRPDKVNRDITSVEHSKGNRKVSARDRPNVTSKSAIAQSSVHTPKELVLRPSEPTSVSDARKIDVPMKVIPKGQITPELTLTPRERLHVEYVTRQPPKKLEPKKGTGFLLLLLHCMLLMSSSLQRTTPDLSRRDGKDQYHLNCQGGHSSGARWLYSCSSTSILCVWLIPMASTYVLCDLFSLLH